MGCLIFSERYDQKISNFDQGGVAYGPYYGGGKPFSVSFLICNSGKESQFNLKAKQARQKNVNKWPHNSFLRMVQFSEKIGWGSSTKGGG